MVLKNNSIKMFFKTFAYYVYIVSCSDGHLYTGITWNLRRRIMQHNGLFWGGAKYTEQRRPVFLQYVERFKTRREAHNRELEIKTMSHNQKKNLITSATKESILASI